MCLVSLISSVVPLTLMPRAINEEMKLGAVRALAALAKEPIPESVKQLYKDPDMKFGRNYILPVAFDPRLLEVVASAVAKAAMESGVARHNITDWGCLQTRSA
jgi:malate dehydrogenase (oxaloacetate-decarboxylating)(NADP+)